MNTSFSSRHYFFLSKEFSCKKTMEKSRLKSFSSERFFPQYFLIPLFIMRQRLEVRQVYCHWTYDEMSRCVWTVISFKLIVCVTATNIPLTSGAYDTVVS